MVGVVLVMGGSPTVAYRIEYLEERKAMNPHSVEICCMLGSIAFMATCPFLVIVMVLDSRIYVLKERLEKLERKVG